MDKQNNSNKNSSTKAYTSEKSQPAFSAGKNTHFVQNRISRIASLYEKINLEYQNLLNRKEQLEKELKNQNGVMFKIKKAIKSFFGLQKDDSLDKPESLGEELEDINLLIEQKEIALSSLSDLTMANSIKLKDYVSEHSHSNNASKSKTQNSEVPTIETQELGM